MNNKNILVIGGSGFLGSHVAEELSYKNYDVTIFDKKKPNFTNKNIKFLTVDINNTQGAQFSLADGYIYMASNDINKVSNAKYETDAILLGTKYNIYVFSVS